MLSPTEARNVASEKIDTLSALQIVELMNSEDALVANAVLREAPAIARAVELIADRLRAGGRLVYQGAGTSGRLGVLDAAECPPTFSSPPGMVVGLIAGGSDALMRAVEGAEDRPELAVDDLRGIALSSRDVLVGIATSGRTPYVIAGLEYARKLGAVTIGLACSSGSALEDAAELMIVPVVGPEIISGSTRLKAGTATKMVLNMLTTATMVLLGKTYGNLMVDLRATNTKLVARSRRILVDLTGLSEAEAEFRLHACNGELKTAIVAARRSVSAARARELLSASGGRLRGERPGIGILTISRRTTTPEGAELPVMADDLVLGVDGGGTKTTAWLARGSSATGIVPLGIGLAGPGNPRAVGFETAQANIAAAVEAAFRSAGIPQRAVRAACLGLAGAGRTIEQLHIREWALSAGLAADVRVTHDAEIILSAGTPDCVGLVLISGTGSLAWGRKRSGETARTGGWGYLLGDEGSGYAIALAGLRAAVQAADGRGGQTALLDLLLQALGVQSPSELVERVYDPQLSRRHIADLSRIVCEASATDECARDIVQSAAADLVSMVGTVARRLDLWREPYDLVCTGGVILNQPSLREKLIEGLRQQGSPARCCLVSDPARGAVVLAIQQ